ncbi:MAG: hypothetical protein ABW148_00045 [Sedimenticola sp.]
MATYLLGLEITHLEEAATERQRIETRMADIVMLAESPTQGRFLLHIELQNQNDSTMAQRMLRYYTDIALAHPKLPIRQYCIYTGRDALSMNAVLDAVGWRYQYTIIDMHRLDCQQFLQQNNPDALVIAILCDFKGQDEEVVLQELVNRLIAMTRGQPDQMRNYLKMMETLSANRGLTDVFKAVEAKMLREVDIEKLPSYQIGLEQGLGKGLEQGFERGRKQVARTALEQGMKIAGITALTGLTEEQILLLKQDQ